jgi:hypothetical protein
MQISDLKVVLTRAAAFGGAPSFKLNFFQFLTHEREPPPKFLSFDFYHDSAVMAAYARFGACLKVANQDRILLTALGTGNVNCFVLEHQQISRSKLVAASAERPALRRLQVDLALAPTIRPAAIQLPNAHFQPAHAGRRQTHLPGSTSFRLVILRQAQGFGSPASPRFA